VNRESWIVDIDRGISRDAKSCVFKGPQATNGIILIRGNSC